MMFVDFQQEGRPVVRCLLGAGPVPESDSSCRSEIARKTQLLRPAVYAAWLGAPKRAKRGCAQCAHPGLRIGSYWCRTGPDCGCFRGSGGNSRAGTRFESHLGHVFSLFRGLWASECAQTVHFMGPCGGPFLLVAVAVAGGSFSWFRAAVALLTRSWPGVPPAA